MRNFSPISLLAILATAPAMASPTDVLDANRDATAHGAWAARSTLSLDYAYSGQGMTGTAKSVNDLKHGWWKDDVAIGPAVAANGFDGEHAWAKDTSGAITIQDGGEQREDAVNDGYRRANLWWRSDRGGASIADEGQKSEAGHTYDVLSITPNGGKKFEAWFDRDSHLLFRIVEQQGTQTFTTTLSGYAPVEGVALAGKTLISNGDVKYDQTVTLTSARFLPEASQKSFAAPDMKLADFSIAGGAPTTSVPFQLINNHVYANVTVNGKGHYVFVLDTGGVNLLTPRVAAELGIKSEGQMQGNGAGSGHMDVGLAKVASLQLGAAQVKDQIFAVTALDQLAPAEGIDMPGMVGFETFRRFVTRFDYGTHTLTLIKPDAFDAKDAGIAVPFQFNGNTIEIKATYAGLPGNFTIDTGSRSSLTLSAPFAAAHDLYRGATSVDAVAGWGIGGPSRARILRGQPLTLGSETVHGPIVEVSTDKAGAMADPSISGNIGAGILKRYIVTLDYGHSTMYLKPATAPVDDLDTFDRAGVWINNTADGFAVVDVTKGAPADAAGLKAGDVIMAVDGTPASKLKLYEVRKQLRDEAPGTVVTFTIRRNQEQQKLAVTLKDLI